MPKEKQQSDSTVTEDDGASLIEVFFFCLIQYNVLFRIFKIKFVTGKAYNPRILYGVKKNKGLPALTGKRTRHSNKI